MLKDPTGGNIEFVFPNKDGSVDDSNLRLYAFSNILEIPTFEYHCSDLWLHRWWAVLNASSSGGIISGPPSPTSDTPPSPSGSPTRRILFVDEDYDLFHLVLFYLYTDRVQFVTSLDSVAHPELPHTSNAEGVYAIAHRLMVRPLEHKAFHFMKSTSNINNITERTFCKFTSLHEEISKWYDTFFLEHWDQIQHLPEFEDYFVRLEDDHEEYVRVNVKFRKMMRGRI